MATPIQEILMVAKEAGASDVHITIGLPPMMRLHGELMAMGFPRLMPDDTREIVYSMMNEKQRTSFEETGDHDFAFAIPSLGRYRVNAFRQRNAVACVMRAISTKIPTPDQLGIPEQVVELYSRKRGLVLVTGPTGSGKSTTLASILDVVNQNRRSHIITMEDPIEYLHSHKKCVVNQREMGADSYTYATALRSALREDPDVILVGEMRDLETISTAITAAETGHLVFSTLHTIGAAATVDRIIDVFPPHQQDQIRVQLGMVLVAVISQQLIPTVDGKGRRAAFEVMLSNPAINNSIREGKTYQIPTYMQTNKAGGMLTMDDSIYALYQEGEISKSDAVEFSQDIGAMKKKLGLA
ncbi:MAG: type IV pilus twitching motility protein PilT [Lachnospiraceae bacterium]|nr:type IV pilus twitching motility protein PilT [Lachnospiraceae bacterium]